MTSGPRTPRVVVVMPVYNGEKYIAEAIQSVLKQTFTDFELLVVDDGSTDRTPEIVSRCTDPRVRVIGWPENKGLAVALNAGIRKSKSDYIARMDADDVCHPHRLERQLGFLDAHPEISICGTWYRTFGAQSVAVRLPTKPQGIRTRLFFGAAMAAPSMMLRRSFLEAKGISFNEDFRNANDFELIVRAAERTQLANLPEFLFFYRQHDAQMTITRRGEQLEEASQVVLRQLRMLIPSVTKEEEEFHLKLAIGLIPASSLRQAEKWLLRLEQANLEQGQYDRYYFQRGLGDWWHLIHKTQAAAGGVRVLMSYWTSRFARIRGIAFHEHLALTAKCFVRRPAPGWWRAISHRGHGARTQRLTRITED